MDPIGSLLLGKALDAVLRGGKAAAMRFFDSPPTVRLLWLLHEQHGDEVGLGKAAFVALDVDASIRTELEALIDGRSDAATAPSILAPLIEPYLVHTPGAQRRQLAESIGRSAARAAPHVVETLQEATGAIVSRTERIGEGLLAALNARDRDGALTRALVQGPLEITGHTQTAAEAQQLAEAGKPSEAAHRYLEVAEALDGHQLAVAAEAYRERAAMLLYAAGDPARAAPLLVEVGRARARRGSDLVGSTYRSLREAPGAIPAIVGGVEALHDWPLNPDGAIAALRAAVEASSGEERIRWLADLVGLMSIFEPAGAVLATVTDDVDSPLALGARLELELDLLDAVEVVDGSEEAETRWTQVLDWVDTRGGAAGRGLVWQRRGVCLARRGDTPAAEMAFRKAMAQWAQSSAGGEQVADGLYSLQAAMALNGGLPGDPEDRILAAELRGPGESDAARAEMLTQWGMRDRIRRRLPEALRRYWYAYAIARRSGSLVSRVEVAETLAELFAEAGREGIALSLLIDAGRGERAAELAEALDGESIALALRPHGARWERGATWHVVAAAGRRLPANAADDLLPLVLAASREPNVGLGSPSLPARRALAALALFAEGDLLEEVLEQLRLELQGPPLEQRKAAAQALVLATNAGITDATEDLLRAFVADPWNIRGVHRGWLKERLEERPELAAIVRPSAIQGSLPLLALLVESGLVEGDAELEAACTQDAQATAQIETVRESEGQISIGMGGSFHLSGISGRCAAGSARAALLARMLAIAHDGRDSEENRALAVGAIDNLAPALTPHQAREAARALMALAVGDYPASVVDNNLDDPLSPTQVRLHTPHLLRAASISALAQIAASHPELDRDNLERVIGAGLRDGPQIVTAAALVALADLPDIASPVPLAHALLAPDRQLRHAALDAWLRREGSLPDDHFLEALMRDADEGIRWRLLVEASKDAGRGPALLAGVAQDDPDVYFRLVACRRAAALES